MREDSVDQNEQFSTSEFDEEIPLEHPSLPSEIRLQPLTLRKRKDLVVEDVEIDDTENEKILRCQKFSEGKFGHIPVSFRENTNKEQLILEHVKKYEDQFKIAYRDRIKELYSYTNLAHLENFFFSHRTNAAPRNLFVQQ